MREIHEQQRFGRLLLLRYLGSEQWVCQCDCGKTKTIRTGNIGRTVNSCGCLRSDVTSARTKIHGESKARIYRVWHSMRERCEDPKNRAYENYGGRGIVVCDEWKEYLPFRNWALSNGYMQGLTIDRKNNDGNYEPLNCRFVTPAVQSRNKRSNVILNAFGESKIISEWAEDSRCAVKIANLYQRIERGWNHEDAIARLPRF